MSEKERLRAESLMRVQAIDDDEVEIDLLQLLFEFKNKILIILLAGILAGGAAGAFSEFVLKPVYTSTSVLYVLSKETTLTSLADLQIGSQLTLDYKELTTSRTVMEHVIDNLGLDLEAKELEEKIAIDNPSNTRILQISVEDGDPVLAKKIADEVANCSSEYIAEIMEMIPPKIVETGEVPIYKTSPKVLRNILIGALCGILLVMGIITLNVVTNDTVRTEDDVAKYLGLPVLAVVPEDTEGRGKKKKQGTHVSQHHKGGGGAAGSGSQSNGQGAKSAGQHDSGAGEGGKA